MAFFAAVVPGMPHAPGSTVLAVMAVAVHLAVVAGALVAGKGGDSARDLPAQLLVSVGAQAIVAIVAAVLFPNLVPATDPALSLAIANSASSDTALSAMTVIACIGVPLMLVDQVIAYRTFRGRVES